MDGTLDRLRETPGDRGLWAELYEELYPKVYYTVFKLSRGNDALAKDLTHEAFLAFYDSRALECVPNVRKATAYVRQTARRLLWDHLQAREIPTEDITISSYLESMWCDSFDAEDELQLRQDVEQLYSTLTEEEREMLVALLRAESVKEIADRLKISYGTAAVRRHRLKKKIFSTVNSL